MKKVLNFEDFLIKEGIFDLKENKLKKKIQQLLLNKDHTEMFLFFADNKKLVGDIENLSTDDMVKKLTDLLDDLNNIKDPIYPFLKAYDEYPHQSNVEILPDTTLKDWSNDIQRKLITR